MQERIGAMTVRAKKAEIYKTPMINYIKYIEIRQVRRGLPEHFIS